jgi:hypothetical protein
MPRWANWWQCWSICGWCGGKNIESRLTHRRFEADLQQPKSMEVEAKSKQVRIQSTFGTITWFPSKPPRNRSKYQTNQSNNWDEPATMHQRCTEADRLYGSSQSFHIKA